MRRRVQDDITLSTGLKLKRGDRVGVDSCRMWDEAYHRDPLKYDPERFLRMRQQPGKEHLAQLVTTSANHLAFG
jgi:cytochrome P450